MYYLFYWCEANNCALYNSPDCARKYRTKEWKKKENSIKKGNEKKMKRREIERMNGEKNTNWTEKRDMLKVVI